MRTKPNSQFSNSLRFAKICSLSALISTAAWAAPATTGVFYGGDPGEGLDLEGNFTYAVNVGPSGSAGQVGDAVFTNDAVAGVSITAGNAIGNGGWLESYLGDTENDLNLATVLNSIRWSNWQTPVDVVTVRLAVEPGNEYKLQLLFAEDVSEFRGFNVIMDGQTEITNLLPARVIIDELGSDFFGTKDYYGTVVTKEFVAAANEVTIVLSGPAADDPSITDRNAILNGLTLEFLRVASLSDTDADGLPDEWETLFFGDLSQTGAADPDSDGLTNVEENDHGTNPTVADADGDGLNDGAEVKTHLTDPANADTDGDGLGDGEEVNRYQTDAAKSDTDSDTVNDYDELRLLSDPKSAQSKPAGTTIGVFTGGDTGEGLDLEGNFIYAIDAGQYGSVGGQVGEALFVAEDLVFDATIATSNKEGVWNGGIVYGESFNDFALAEIMASISWSDWNRATSAVHISLSNLVVGASYKLQLLFAEQAWPRGFDVFVDGLQVADDFAPVFYQGGGFPLAYLDTQGVVLTHTFVARRSDVSIILDGRGTTTPQFTDHNAIVNALTLEHTGDPADTDSDSLPDGWENNYFGNLAQTGSQDADGDTISNATELADGTNPSKADSDNDGLSDAQEKTGTTKAGFPDSDFDGLTDGAEVATHNSDPTKWDTDMDGISDGYEVNVLESDPTKPLSRAIVQAFTGGDAGEGLDLDGTFVYAFSILPDSAAQGQVRDANFTSENVPGVTIGRAGSQAANWYVPDFGTTLNDDTLEIIVPNIRHGNGGIDITLDNLVPGSLYKLQLMFGEQCCARAMDILVDGRLIADDFAPFITQGGINIQTAAAVVIYEFIAATNSTTISTMNTVTNPRYPDTNPIFNALTLEEIAVNADSDGDGLPDPWETYYFANLTATGTGDPDGDGLDNTGEFQFGTDPNASDADGDGLNDDGERTAGSNPNIADTDGDNLLDGVEVNTHQSDPNHHDTDRDGFADAAEVARGSNPATADSGTTVGVFTGGDAGEGLDLDGTFVYAFSVLPDTFAIGQVRDAVFTSENVEGVAIAQAPSQIPNWYVPEFGSTPNDDVLEQVVQNIRHGGGGATITLGNLTPGNRYKLQMIFGEACCARAMDVSLDGELIADDFAPYILQGGLYNAAQAAVLTHEFTASSATAVIRTLGGAAVGIRKFTDTNPIINAVTLESLGAAPPSMRITAFSRTATGVSVTFDSVNGRSYVLEYKASLTDATWQDAGNAAATGATTTLADDNAAHRDAPAGFWRIRGQ